MASRWRRIAYMAFWLAILAWVLTSDWREADGVAQMVVFTFLLFLTAPVSIVVSCGLFVLGLLLPDAERILIETIAGGSLMVSDPQWFKIRFSIWWLLLIGASYWQWFWLTPKLLSILGPMLGCWMRRGDNRDVSSETPRT